MREDLPFVAVAAMFQRDPPILLAHPGAGHDSFEALRGAPIMVGADSRVGWWNFLRARFGFTDAQIRPYTFNLAPFLADKGAVQQGYLGSEPFLVREAAGFDPVVLLLADAGFSGYGSLITASTKLVEGNPDLMQRFLDASVEGWVSYLHGDPAPGNVLIKVPGGIAGIGRPGDGGRRGGGVRGGDRHQCRAGGAGGLGDAAAVTGGLKEPPGVARTAGTALEHDDDGRPEITDPRPARL